MTKQKSPAARLKPLKLAQAAEPPKTAAAPLAVGRLADNVGFHIRLCAINLFRDYVAATGPGALTPMQVTILELLRVNPGASQVDLASVLSADKATMMALVDRLHQAGLLTRQTSQMDRRRQVLLLTPQGKTALKASYTTVKKQQDNRLGRLEKAEIAQLLDLLKRLHVSPRTSSGLLE